MKERTSFIIIGFSECFFDYFSPNLVMFASHEAHHHQRSVVRPVAVTFHRLLYRLTLSFLLNIISALLLEMWNLVIGLLFRVGLATSFIPTTFVCAHGSWCRLNGWCRDSTAHRLYRQGMLFCIITRNPWHYTKPQQQQFHFYNIIFKQQRPELGRGTVLVVSLSFFL